VGGLLLGLPFRYEDRSRMSRIADLRPGESAVVSGRILDSRLIRTRRRGFTIQEAVLDDGTDTLRVVWFNQPYLSRALSSGRRAVLFGAAERETKGLVMKSPEHEFFDAEEERDPIHLGRVVGIYRRRAGLSSKWLRKLIFASLEALEPAFACATAPAEVAAALHTVHFPAIEDWERTTAGARATLAREELLVFCDSVEERRARRSRQCVSQWDCPPSALARLERLLPFPLTKAQQRAIGEISGDLRGGRPMARLLQGDVGSGKTAVALIAALICADNGRQAALMAPTEILAEQHAEVIARWLAGTRYRAALLTGRTREGARRTLRAALRRGELDLLIGTHALVEKPVEFRNMGLAIIDEQHRFGVAHRARLSRKGERPHVLVLTATPIPRSLAWTLFGDLDVSLLEEKPPGRGAVRTFLRGFEKRPPVYDFLADRLREGERGYVVVPAIEESAPDIAAAQKTLADVRRMLPSARADLLHGRLAPEARQEAMRRFAEGGLNVLVATTVIEVGIDVPEATVMIIENAERFGLAQLHQLRGRIGRGKKTSYCILLASEKCGEEARQRLSFLESCDDGFQIAEKDLELRGPGDLLGLRQSGLPEFVVADPFRDLAHLRTAREEARRRRAAGEAIRSDLFPLPGSLSEATG
jgi:ATP-dependent DNA helicase RecG